jgi:hypothetical protein
VEQRRTRSSSSSRVLLRRFSQFCLRKDLADFTEVRCERLSHLVKFVGQGLSRFRSSLLRGLSRFRRSHIAFDFVVFAKRVVKGTLRFDLVFSPNHPSLNYIHALTFIIFIVTHRASTLLCFNRVSWRVDRHLRQPTSGY